MTIPNIIKQQLLQTNTAIVWSWGASKWVALSDNTLGIRVHARRLDGIVRITLDEAGDLYNVSFFNNKSFSGLLKNPSEQYHTIEGVYCDQLLDLIDEVIEKISDYQF